MTEKEYQERAAHLSGKWWNERNVDLARLIAKDKRPALKDTFGPEAEARLADYTRKLFSDHLETLKSVGLTVDDVCEEAVRGLRWLKSLGGLVTNPMHDICKHTLEDAALLEKVDASFDEAMAAVEQEMEQEEEVEPYGSKNDRVPTKVSETIRNNMPPEVLGAIGRELFDITDKCDPEHFADDAYMRKLWSKVFSKHIKHFEKVGLTLDDVLDEECLQLKFVIHTSNQRQHLN